MNNDAIQPVYSFLIPNYNCSPECISRLLNSIPCRQDTEIIFCDDASDIFPINPVQFEHIKNLSFILLKDNIGSGASRNLLLEKAKGKYVIYLDSDDCCLTPEMNTFLDIAKNVNYDIVYWGTQTINLNGKTTEEHYGYIGNDIKPINTKIPFVYHSYEPWRKIIKKSYLVKRPDIRFDTCKISQDVIFCIKSILYTDSIAVYPPVTYSYIRRDSSAQGKRWNIKVYQDVAVSLNTAFRLLKDNGYDVCHQYTSAIFLKKVMSASVFSYLKYLFIELKIFGIKLFLVDIDRTLLNSFFTHNIKRHIK